MGSGGREHALAQVLGRSAEVVVTPGNPGIPESVSEPPEEIEADLFVIGPEAPLVDGLADRLRHRGRLVFGPGTDGARLEGSKAWMKEVLVEAGVPTARYGAFTDRAAARAFLDRLDGLFVVKTDGLAAGKGVLVTGDREEADAAVTGPELSVLAVCDGTTAVPLAPAQDFKRLGDGDSGPNTGGMGAYSPVPVATERLVDDLMEEAVLPTLAALQSRGIDYRGVLYCGLMLTPEGPRVLEYNVRFGDPETQVVLPRMVNDLADLLAAAAAGTLGDPPAFDDDAAVTVVCATEGYPATPCTGDAIDGAEAASDSEHVTVFYSGVDRSGDHLVTAGGRVLAVTGKGATLAEARDRAYAGVEKISWPGMHHRVDIAAHPTGASD